MVFLFHCNDLLDLNVPYFKGVAGYCNTIAMIFEDNCNDIAMVLILKLIHYLFSNSQN